MTNENMNRWALVFSGVSAIACAVSVLLMYTQTPLYQAPPVLKWDQSVRNTSSKNKDGLYASTLRVSIANLGSHPAKDVTVVVSPVEGKNWTVSSVHATTTYPSTPDTRAFRIAVIPARTKAEFDCIELLEQFPSDRIHFMTDMDKYDREAGSKEFDYHQRVFAVFTEFGPVPELQLENWLSDFREQKYVPEDYRSKDGKERRERVLRSHGLRDQVGFGGTTVVPIDTPDPFERADAAAE